MQPQLLRVRQVQLVRLAQQGQHQPLLDQLDLRVRLALTALFQVQQDLQVEQAQVVLLDLQDQPAPLDRQVLPAHKLLPMSKCSDPQATAHGPCLVGLRLLR